MTSGFARSCLIVGTDLMLLLALPYVVDLRVELETLRIAHAHQEFGSVNPSLTRKKDADPPVVASNAQPRRAMALPDVSGDSASAYIASDPFLAEARRRAEEDPEAAMQWLQSQSTGTERLRGMLEVVALWAAEDSESALLWLESNAQGLARLETLNSGVELWAQQNPEAAAGWIDGMASDGSKLAAAKSLAAKWVESDPEAAAKWVSGLPNDPVRAEATRALAEAWVQQDPEAASVWAFEEAEFNGNYELLNTTIREFSKQSPEDAEAFVRSMAEAGHSNIALASHVVGRAEQDPVATAKWLSGLSPTDPIYSDDYAGSLMAVWAESDSIAASEWLSQMPQGAQRDDAAYGFSESIQRYEPEAAAAWANTIRDPERRVERLEASIRTWAESRPVEALEWLKRAELEPGLREQLAREIPWD